MESLRDKIIGRLTNYRQLTSADKAELDTFAVALDLNDNDPFWGQILWSWATLPRQEKFDISLRAFAAEIRNDVQSLLSSQVAEINGIGGSVEDPRLDEIKAMLKMIADRPVSTPAQAQVTIDPKALQSSIAAALAAAMSGKKAMVSVQDFFKVFREVMREIVGWMTAGVAAILIGVCLYLGYSAGEKYQASTDFDATTALKKQNDVLEQQIATLTKLVGRNR